MPKRQRPSGPSGPLETSKQALGVLTVIEEHMDQLLEPVKGSLQETFDGLGGSFDSFDASRRVVRRVQHLLNRLRLGLECQGSGCGKPGRLRCNQTMATLPWVFQFEHSSIGGKQRRHGYWGKFPPLKLVNLADEDLRRPRLSAGEE